MNTVPYKNTFWPNPLWVSTEAVLLYSKDIFLLSVSFSERLFSSYSVISGLHLCVFQLLKLQAVPPSGSSHPNMEGWRSLATLKVWVHIGPKSDSKSSMHYAWKQWVLPEVSVHVTPRDFTTTLALRTHHAHCALDTLAHHIWVRIHAQGKDPKLLHVKESRCFCCNNIFCLSGNALA